MSPTNKNNINFHKEILLPIGLFLFFACLIFAFWFIAERGEKKNVEKVSQEMAGQMKKRLESWINSRIAIIEFFAGKWETRIQHDQENFSEEAKKIIRLYAGFKALNWIDEKMVIRVVVPKQGNEAALNQDLHFHPSAFVLPAIERAIQAKKISRTPTITLLQGEKGFASYRPIFDAEQKLIGIINGVFLTDSLINRCFGEKSLRDQYRFEIHEIDGAKIFSHQASLNPKSPFAAQATIQVVDQPWKLLLAPQSAIIVPFYARSQFLMLFVGLTLAFAAALLFRNMIVQQGTIQESEARFRNLYEKSSIGLYRTDPEGNLLLANPALVKIFGCHSFEDMLHVNFNQVDFDPDFSREKFKQIIFEKREIQGLKGSWKKRDGSTVFLRGSARALYDKHGNLMFYEGTVEDITERKIAEDQLKLSEEKYRLLFTDANEGILILDMKGRIIDANAKLFSITGYAFHEIVGKSIIDFAAQLQINVRQIVRDYKDLFVEKLAASDWTIVNRAGEKIDITIKPSYIKKEGKNIGISTIISDITERKQAEEKIKFASLQWRSTFDAISDAIALLDLQGTILRCNRAMAKFSGKNFSELIGKNCAEMLYGPGKRPAGCPYLRAQKTLKRETLLLPLDNRWFEIAVDPEFDDKKNLIGFVHIMSDVTERKKTEKQIKAALLEKEVLLKEVHHRVKNNLQTIISLLNLQAHRAGDAKISQSLEKCKQRIFSMAMVHAELYKSDDFSYINFKSYLDKLVKNMVTSYQLERKIEVDLQIDDINFDIDTAIPCGLLLNELIANSIKHAFPKNCSGKINISLQRIKNKNYELRFQDDGIGLPENFDIHKSHTLGMVLINTLTAQLRGKLEIQTETGTIFNIVFPRKKK